MRRTLSILPAAVLFALTSTALAQSPLSATSSMRDNLKSLMTAKTPVTVVLSNGQTYKATIGSVGEDFVLLTGPAQKEFYDVLVDLDEISALEVRARN